MIHIKNSSFLLLLTLAAANCQAYQVTIENDTKYTGIKVQNKIINPGKTETFATNDSHISVAVHNYGDWSIDISKNHAIKLSQYKAKIEFLNEFGEEQRRQNAERVERERQAAARDSY